MNDASAAQTTTGNPVEKPRRLMSLDALRGFDMFWIVGADALVEGLQKLSNGFLVQGTAHQLEHADWSGFHFEDLIFPMFVFMAGVSLTFSLTRMIEQDGRPAATGRIVRRAVLMYLLGIFYYGGFDASFEHIRLLGVLQRIALAYLFAGLIFCYCQRRGQVIWCGGLLIGYWLVLTFVPVPGGTAGNFAEGANLTNWIDAHCLPLRKWDGDHDPEGLLSTLPAIASCLLGVLAGQFLRESKRSDWNKVARLALAGVILAAVGWLWSLQFPVIKKIWTSSFVLVAGGYSCLFLAAFYTVIEIWQWRRWAQPFVWIGMNSITIYLIHDVVDIEKIAQRFAGGQLNEVWFGRFGPLVLALLSLGITFWICRFLYRRGIFLRL
ncbi:MAG: acyltransferase family protein [Verrucomicrobiota bacterium]|jgi:predicted acyltransferase